MGVVLLEPFVGAGFGALARSVCQCGDRFCEMVTNMPLAAWFADFLSLLTHAAHTLDLEEHTTANGNLIASNCLQQNVCCSPSALQANTKIYDLTHRMQT